MKRSKRRGKPRLPEFPPVERLVVGQAFNPLRLFISGSVHRALGGFPKLSASAKWVYIVLADQCYSKGYDWHSEANLAELAGMSVRQVRRHLRRLKRLRLVRSQPDLGRSNRTWLLFHPLFALCHPATPVRSDLPPRTETAEGSGQKRPTHEQDHEQGAWSGGSDLSQATSYRGSVAPKGESKAKVNGNGKGLAASSDNEENVQFLLPLRRTPGWYALSEHEKRNRADRIGRICERIYDLRQHLNDRDPHVARSARQQIEREMDTLRDYGVLKHNQH